MSIRRSDGFTLLELQVAILVLVLTVLGLMSLLGTHEKLVRSMEDVAAGDRTLYVVAPGGPFDALAGVPARLDESAPAPAPSEPWYPYDVTVKSVAHELDPPRSVAQVKLKKAKKKKDEDEEEGEDEEEDEDEEDEEDEEEGGGILPPIDFEDDD